MWLVGRALEGFVHRKAWGGDFLRVAFLDEGKFTHG